MSGASENRTASPTLEGWGPLVVLLSVVVLFSLLSLMISQLPLPLARRVDDGVFSAGRALASLERLLGSEGAHPAGSLAASRVRAHLETELHNRGWQPEEQVLSLATEEATGRVHNWTVAIEGKDKQAGWVLAVAHTDSVAAGPGVSDDLAGVAVVIEAVRALCARGQPERGILLLFSDAEEDGLCGAEAFAAQDPRMGSVVCVLNVEARGCRGPSIMFQTGPGSGDLVRAYARHARRPFADALSEEAYRRMPNDTDLSVFRQRQLPGLNFAFIEGHEVYHTGIDDLEHLSLHSLQHQGDQFFAGLQAAQDVDFSRTPRPMPVWTAVGSRTLFIMGEGTLQSLGIGLLLLCVLALRQHQSRAGDSGGRWTEAFLGWPLWMGALILGAMVPGRLLAWALGVPDPGAAHPLLFWLSTSAACMALAALVVFPHVRRVGLVPALGVCQLMQALVLAIVTFAAPGAGTWLVGVVLLGTLGLWGAILRVGAGGMQRAAFWTLGPALLLAVPLVRLLAAAYGSAQPEIPCVLLALVGLPALVSVSSLSSDRALRVAGGAGLLCLIGSLALFLLPVASEELPRRQNIILMSKKDEPVRRVGGEDFPVTWDEQRFTPRFTESGRAQEGAGVRVWGVLSGGGPWGVVSFEGLDQIRLGGRELSCEEPGEARTSLFALELAGIEVSFVLGDAPAKVVLLLNTPLVRLGVDADALRKPHHLASGRGDRLISTRVVFEEGQPE